MWIKALEKVRNGTLRLGLISTTRWLESRISSAYNRRYRNFDPRKQLFGRISIETIAKCNKSCYFCPNSKIERLEGQMSTNILNLIFDDLKRLRYGGIICLFRNGEPFLDDGIVDIIRMARTSCPDAHLQIQSNGTILTREVAQDALTAGLDKLIVNDYGDGVSNTIREWKMPIEVRTFTRDPDYVKKFYHSWAGHIDKEPRLNYQLPLSRDCVSVYTHLTVGIDGSILPCCMDWKYELRMGNIEDDSLSDIWAGDRYESLRDKLRHGDREGLLCEKCDALR